MDLGCGIGLMAFYLRERGFVHDVTGIDHDAAKVEAARVASAGDPGLAFVTGDVRTAPLYRASVLILDVVHYLDDAEQSHLLERAARSVPPGGVVVIRTGLRDGTWRYRVTRAAEALARAVHWTKAERLNFPTRAVLMDSFPGFAADIMPLWGSTPFNNYLFVFSRSSEGTTNA